MTVRARSSHPASSAGRARLSSGYGVAHGLRRRRSSRSTGARSRSPTRGRCTSRRRGHTKLDLVQLLPRRRRRGPPRRRWAADGPQAVRGRHRRAAVLPEAGARQPPRLDPDRELTFPSGRTADEIVIEDAAGLAWVANLGCIDLNPHPVRADDLDHPDELRVDLDPVPGRRVAADPRRRAGGAEALEAVGLVGWPKTSGSRGIHINVRIEPRWTFPEVRRAALALARDVERRAPGPRHQQVVEGGTPRRLPRLQPEREGPDGRLGLLRAAAARRAGLDAADLGRGPDRRGRGVHDRHGAGPVRRRSATRGTGIDDAVGLARGPPGAQPAPRGGGLGDAPWPPNYAKQAGEPPRVQPSRARRPPVRVRAGSRGGRRPAAGGRRGACRRRGGRRSRTPACRPNGQGRARRRPAAARPRSRSSRSRGPSIEGRGARGLERWKSRHPEAAAVLEPADVLVDGMRGRSSLWYRVRVNLIHVPEADRPAQEPLESDYDPWAGMDIEAWKAATAGSRARRPGSPSKARAKEAADDGAVAATATEAAPGGAAGDRRRRRRRRCGTDDAAADRRRCDRRRCDRRRCDRRRGSEGWG